MAGNDFNPQQIEKKWQERWEKDKIFEVKEEYLRCIRIPVLNSIWDTYGIIQLATHLHVISECAGIMSFTLWAMIVFPNKRNTIRALDSPQKTRQSTTVLIRKNGRIRIFRLYKNNKKESVCLMIGRE
jgi:hypothetical protein